MMTYMFAVERNIDRVIYAKPRRLGALQNPPAPEHERQPPAVSPNF